MFDSVILVGPGTNLFPITNSSLKIMNLPIINTELLLLNITFLQPVSRKIYIVILQQDVHNITHLINIVNVPVEIIAIDYYDGTVQQLLKIQNRIKSDNIIVTKGDVITNIDIRSMADEFIDNKTSFLTVLSKNENGATVAYTNDELIFYSRDENYELDVDIFTKRRVNLSKEVDTLQFYMFTKDMFKYFSPDLFSFRNNLFPLIVDRLRDINPVKIYNPMDNYIFQIRDVTSYTKIIKFLKIKYYTDNDNLVYSNEKLNAMRQYIRKNKLTDTKNIIGDDLAIENGFIVNSVIGNNVKIDNNSQVMSSILLNNIFIGSNCFIEECLIGSGVVIPDNTTLIKCTVSPSYEFSKSLSAKLDTFSCN